VTDKVDGSSRSQPCADASALALDALRSAAELATPGPWTSKEGSTGYPECDDRDYWAVVLSPLGREIVTLQERYSGKEDDRRDYDFDAAFIALANPATILSLIAEHRALTALITEQDEGLAKYEGEIEALTARVASLEAGLKSITDELESELRNRYEGVLDHPAMKSRFDRDMVSVDEARALLIPTQTKD
jgi:hypothetical protein